MNRLQRYLQLRRHVRWRPKSLGRRGVIVRFHDYHPELLPCTHNIRVPPAANTPYRRHRAAVLAITATVLSGLSWWFQTGTSLHSLEYTTGVGEHRTIPLPDGSVVVMNTRSDLRVRFSAHARDVNLISGEAAFSVAPDPNRPFTVHTQRTEVTALGTQFCVYLGDSSTTITVTEGSARILPSRATWTRGLAWARGLPWARPDVLPITDASQGFAVSAGQQARVARERNGVASFDIASRWVSAAELERQIAWVNGQLAFDEQPLKEVVREFNRYNWRQLRIIDPTLEQLRVDGRFKSTHLNEFVRELNRVFGVQALFVADPRSHDPVIELRRAQLGPP